MPCLSSHKCTFVTASVLVADTAVKNDLLEKEESDEAEH
jgi:hypothetical protein